jgi:RNA polymerase sigma factor (sigma-70 family)
VVGPRTAATALPERGSEDLLTDFEAVYAENKGFVRNYVRLFVRVRGLPDVDVDDITQETWIRVRQGKDTFSGQGSFRSWLRAVARNTCCSFYRVAYRQKEVLVEDIGNVVETTEEYWRRDKWPPLSDGLLYLPLERYLAFVRDTLAPRVRRILRLPKKTRSALLAECFGVKDPYAGRSNTKTYRRRVQRGRRLLREVGP